MTWIPIMAQYAKKAYINADDGKETPPPSKRLVETKQYKDRISCSIEGRGNEVKELQKNCSFASLTSPNLPNHDRDPRH